MSEPEWQDVMNEEYEAAGTEEARRAVLEKYMGPDMAARATAAIEVGATSSVRDVADDPEDRGD